MTTKPSAQKKPRSRPIPKRLWHLVTNQQNMLFMLAAGMVMSPLGFRGKHYSDSLSDFPGWIPLFRNTDRIPVAALSRAAIERRHLLPCIASFDLSGLSSPVRRLLRDGGTRDVPAPAARKGRNDIATLVRAPLPLMLLSSINFRSIEDKQAFESNARDVFNVDLSRHRIEVVESLFSTNLDAETWPPAKLQGGLFGADADNPPVRGQALGGVIAMLYHTANRSALGLAAFRLAAGAASERDSDLVHSDPILAELPNWLDGGGTNSQADIRARLFWGVIHTLVFEQTRECPQTPVDAALTYLDSQLDQLREMEFRTRLERLIADMRSCLGLGGGTVTELLERHKGSLSRPLLLFCLRESCIDLLEFSHPLLSDVEFLLAGILFGARDSWLQLPRELRTPKLAAFAEYHMAESEHREWGDGFALVGPRSPIPLRELFVSPTGEWSSVQKEIALELARDCGWNECIQTRITLAEGDYPATFERNDLQVILPGRVSITEILDKARFLHRLAQWPPVTPEIESGVRKKLASAWEIEEKVHENGSSCG